MKPGAIFKGRLGTVLATVLPPTLYLAVSLVISVVISVVISLALPVSARAETVSVAVASNFIKPMKALAEQFHQSTGHRANLSFGSSGKLYAQIVNGAPFEVFLSADQSKPITLEQQGLAVADSRFTYAQGTLILWSSQPGFIENNADRLQTADFKKLAIANPKLAPYGRAAVEVLERLKLTEKIADSKIVLGQNIAQTYQFVSSGNAELGMVALSQVTDNGQMIRGSGWGIPKNLYSPIKQDALLLKSGEHNPAAKALVEYIRSERAKALINRFGYGSDEPY